MTFPPKQFHLSTTFNSKHFPLSTTFHSKQFPLSKTLLTKQFPLSTTFCPKHFPLSTTIHPKQFCLSTTLLPKQFYLSTAFSPKQFPLSPTFLLKTIPFVHYVLLPKQFPEPCIQRLADARGELFELDAPHCCFKVLIFWLDARRWQVEAQSSSPVLSPALNVTGENYPETTFICRLCD